MKLRRGIARNENSAINKQINKQAKGKENELNSKRMFAVSGSGNAGNEEMLIE